MTKINRHTKNVPLGIRKLEVPSPSDSEARYMVAIAS